MVRHDGRSGRAAVLLLPGLFRGIVTIPALIFNCLRCFSGRCSGRWIRFCVQGRRRAVRLSSVCRELPVSCLWPRGVRCFMGPIRLWVRGLLLLLVRPQQGRKASLSCPSPLRFKGLSAGFIISDFLRPTRIWWPVPDAF